MDISFPSTASFTARGGLELATLGPSKASGKDLERFFSPESGDDVADHTAFDALLAKFVRRSEDGIVRVDYREWTRVAADRVALRRYIDGLARMDPLRLRTDEQFAFWANLYNALILNLLLQHTPIASIRNIHPSTVSPGPWKLTVVQVGAVGLSLDDIEHSILRRRWPGPSVHYALSCAAVSGPNLSLRAWRGAGLTAALEAAGRAFVNHPRGVQFSGGALVVSSIYKWYAADFGGAGRGVLAHLARLAEPPLRAKLQSARRVGRYAYDWSLNTIPST